MDRMWVYARPCKKSGEIIHKSQLEEFLNKGYKLTPDPKAFEEEKNEVGPEGSPEPENKKGNKKK